MMDLLKRFEESQLAAEAADRDAAEDEPELARRLVGIDLGLPLLSAP